MSDEELITKLKTIANELREKLPSKIASSQLQELEEMLNLLYQKFSSGMYSKDLEKAILKALGLAAYLNDVQLRAEVQPRPPEFFVSIKKLSQMVPVILFFLEEKLYS